MDYRRILRENLSALFRSRGYSVKNPPPIRYLGGTKRGKLVSARTIQYILAEKDDTHSPSLDVLAAIAQAFELQPWQLLVPKMPTGAGLRLVTERELDAEVAKRVAARMQTLQRQFATMLQGNEHEASNDVDEGPDSQAPGPGKSGNAA